MGRLMKPSRRVWALFAALALGSSMSIAWAEGITPKEDDLPELGSPANAAISLEEEYSVGLMFARSMRESGVVLEDPEVSEYIQDIGHRLPSRAEEGQHQFTYYVVKDPVIN